MIKEAIYLFLCTRSFRLAFSYVQFPFPETLLVNLCKKKQIKIPSLDMNFWMLDKFACAENLSMIAMSKEM